jgi:tRNA(Arg) A34 adenosine deaminase TadA
MSKFIKLAIREARKARHKQHKFGAVLIRGGKIIASSHNHSSIHCEHSVLDRAWKSGTENSVLLIVRVRKDGSFGLAWPCDVCLSRMAENGVKKVIYSTNSGMLAELKIASISIDYPSIYPYLLPSYSHLDDNRYRASAILRHHGHV